MSTAATHESWEESADRPAYFALVLHAHLPFVRHPEHDVFVEEDWFYEALTETYIPLLQRLEGLQADGIPFQLTISLSGTLLTMLGDDLLRCRYERHLQDLRKLVRAETSRSSSPAPVRALAEHYEQQLEAVKRTWDRLEGDLITPLARLQEQGHVDLLTSGATHGYLPLLAIHPQSVWAQIKVGVDLHTQVIGQPPSGFWLPECGYAPGIDALVARAGLRYFVTENHALLHARPRARYGCYAPVFCKDSAVAAFARDPLSAEQVWSRRRGYPGDPVYRDFYRDVGFERPAEQLGPFAQPDGRRRHTGIKYFRVTGGNGDKALYDPAVARQQATRHARDFVGKRVRHLGQLRTVIPLSVIVAPYDAELFGHWWYEGCDWIDETFREIAKLPEGALRPTGLGHYLQQHCTHQVTQPAQSSWGQGGYHRFWLDGSNAWIYPRLHRAAEVMIQLARRFTRPSRLQRRALNHAARQLLLAQASDWAFIMRDNTVVDYAVTRTERHLRDFDMLSEQLRGDHIDEPWLEKGERTDNIFPRVDYRVFSDQLDAAPGADRHSNGDNVTNDDLGWTTGRADS